MLWIWDGWLVVSKRCGRRRGETDGVGFIYLFMLEDHFVVKERQKVIYLPIECVTAGEESVSI